MKKMLLSLAVFTAFGASAQIYSEDFTNAASWTAATAWTVYDADGDTYNWGVYSLSSLGAPFAAQGNAALSFSYGDPDQGQAPTALNPDNFFFSPPIDLTGSSTASLSFKVGALDGQYFAEHYALYAITDLATIATATPVLEETLTAADSNITSRTVNLNAVAGAGNDSVYLVFRHYNVSDQYAMMIDDIMITVAPLGLNENAISANVYPNPTSDVLNIKSSEGIASVTITSMDGKVVASANASSISVAELNAGMYLYTATTETGKVANGNFVKK